MARRRREALPDGGDPGSVAEVPAVEGAEPQLRVQMTGSADQVKRQLGVAVEDKPEKSKPENGHDDEKKRFVDALRNSKYIIRVKRMTPRDWNGEKINVEVWQESLPLAYSEIQSQVAKDHGGGKYRVAVVDPASNITICADTFELDGDPIVPESDLSQDEQNRIFMQTQPKSAADLTEDGLDRRARVSAKLLEVESIENQLEEARNRRKGGKSDDASNARIDELDRKLAEAKHQAELEARDRKHAEEMRELKALIAQSATPKKSEDSTMMILLEQMREDRKAASLQFTALLTQMKDDKLNAVLDEVKSIRNKPNPQSSSLIEQADAMLKLKKLFGWGGADEEDEDEDDDKDDDRPWWERALDKLGDKLGGKVGDEILEKIIGKFSAMEEKGETVSREEFMRNIGEYADKVADEAIAKKQQRTLPPSPQQTLPAPPAPPRPVVTLPPAPATTLPPPPPAAPAQEPQVPVSMTIEQEILLRVGGVLGMIDREIALRPNEYLWNYEGAYNSLPEEILEKVCAAPDPVTMMDAFAIQGIAVEKLEEIKAKIAGNPRIAAWLKAGHDELKDWFAEKLKNPKFDPFAEEASEEGEGN